jgi:hypothetical protein
MNWNSVQTTPSQVTGANRSQLQSLGGSGIDPYRQVGFRGNVCGYGLFARQISGSLQDTRQKFARQGVHSRSLAQLMRGSQRAVVVRSLNGVQSVSLSAGFGDSYVVAQADARPKSPEVETKVAASFVGKVESLSGATAIVVLYDEQTGEQIESQCDEEVLRENGIAESDWFRCKVIRHKGGATACFEKLATKPPSKEKVDRCYKDYIERWSF